LTYLVEIFLPLADQAGETFCDGEVSQVMEELKRKLGGVTVYDRSPAKGKTITSSDDIVIFEAMTDDWSAPGGPPAGRLRKTKSLSALPASNGYSRPQVSWEESDFLRRQIHEC
jgi:hypothetical protein